MINDIDSQRELDLLQREFEQDLARESVMIDRYNEYVTLCENGDVTPFSYEDWLEFDKSYQEHVRTAGSVLSPATFQKLQENEDPLNIKGKELEELRSMYRNLVRENENLISDLAESDKSYTDTSNELNEVKLQVEQLKKELYRKSPTLEKREEQLRVLDQEIIHTREALTKANQTNYTLAKELDDLQTMYIEYKKQSGDEITRIAKLNDELRTQLEAKDQEAAGLVDKVAELALGLTRTQNTLSGVISQQEDKQGSINRLADQLSQAERDLDQAYNSRTEALRVKCEAAHENQLLKEENERLNLECEELFDQLSEENTEVDVLRATPANQPRFPHYFKAIPESTHVDIYWVLKAWEVVDPCVQHAVKKLMAAGRRGAKDTKKDLEEARDSITRALEIDSE